MAIFTIARKLSRLYPNQVIPFLIHSSTQLSIPSLHSPPQTKHFFQAFRQTPSVHSLNPNSRALRDSHIQAPKKIIDFNEFIIDTGGKRPGVRELVTALKGKDRLSSIEEGIDFLEELGVELNEELVFWAIFELRAEWKSAFIVFKWGEKRYCLGENVWALMIWVLGNCKKFKISWALIREMYESSVDTRQAMLVMIDRYTAANDPSKAIHTFEIMEKFRITPDIEAFHTLLSCLCKWGNVEEAEDFMLSNKKLFPLKTESFNIILDGWCNISVNVLEAKRVWREMSKMCILPDRDSYMHMVSCFSKVVNLFDSLRLYDEMKKRDFAPGLEVYNSLVYVLSRENCLEQAMRILEKMKEEGLKPNSITYNSMIRPLCDASKLDEARNILATMIKDNTNPTIETYHSFLEVASNDETKEILNHMKKAGIGPNKNTFLRIFRKLFLMKQPEEALTFLDEMKGHEIEVDYGHYCVLVEGLVSCGWLVKAREIYNEMKVNGFVDDPKIKKLLNEPSLNSSRITKRNTQLRSGQSGETRRRKPRKKLRRTNVS